MNLLNCFKVSEKGGASMFLEDCHDMSRLKGRFTLPPRELVPVQPVEEWMGFDLSNPYFYQPLFGVTAQKPGEDIPGGHRQ